MSKEKLQDMREIKFRAWDGEKMWYGGEIYSKSKDGNRSYPCEITSRGIEFIRPYDSKHSDIIIDEQGREGYQDWDIEKTNRDCEVMQFTGMKDKNGVDIYEGDILTKSYYPYIDEGKQNYVSIVEWCFAGFHTVLECVNKDKRGISSGINEPIEFGDEFEIIGNIHEHKHLLK